MQRQEESDLEMLDIIDILSKSDSPSSPISDSSSSNSPPSSSYVSMSEVESKKRKRDEDPDFIPSSQPPSDESSEEKRDEKRKPKRLRLDVEPIEAETPKIPPKPKKQMPVLEKVTAILSNLMEQCRALTEENRELKNQLESIWNPLPRKVLDKAKNLYGDLIERCKSLAAKNIELLEFIDARRNPKKMATLMRSKTVFDRIVQKRDALTAENAELKKQIEELTTLNIMQSLGSGTESVSPELSPGAVTDFSADPSTFNPISLSDAPLSAIDDEEIFGAGFDDFQPLRLRFSGGF